MKRDLYSLVHEEFFPLEDGPNNEVSKPCSEIAIAKSNNNYYTITL